MSRATRTRPAPTTPSPDCDAEPRPGAAARGASRRLAIASVGVLLAAADTYVVVLVLTDIMRDVGLGIDQLQRAAPVISGFLLGYVVVLPLLGRLSDIVGRAPVFLGCLALFAVGSMLTAAAHDLAVVVVGRTIQGLGGGGLVPVTLAVVADSWPAQRRGLPLGAVGAVQEVGSVLGPLYGSAIVALSGWRLIFWLNLPVAAVLGIAFAIAAPGGVRRTAADHGAVPSRRHLDVVGAVLGVLGLAALLLAVLAPDTLAQSDSLGQLYLPLLGHSELTTPLAVAATALLLGCGAWELWTPLGVRPLLPLRRIGAALVAVDWLGALLLAGALGCVILSFATADPSHQVVASGAVVTLPLAAAFAVAFCLRELRCADPLVDLRGLRAPAAGGGLAVNLLVGVALMAALVDIPFFARSTVDTSSQGAAALELVRFLVGVPIGALLGGAVCERLSYRVTAAAGMLLSAAMFVLMSRWGQDAMAPRLGVVDVELVACGIGFGLCIAPVNAAVLGAMREALHGLASSLVVVARTMGMLGGLALLTAIGLRRFYSVSAGIPSPLRLCPQSPGHCPAYDELARLAVVDELHAIFTGAAVAALAAALLAALTLRRGDGAPAPRLAIGERATAALGGAAAGPRSA